MLEQGITIDKPQTEERSILPLWQEFQHRVANYQQFLGHIGNCLMHLLYDVPIPQAVKERD